MSYKNNYTDYPNKIGLFLNESDDVVLSFPYKDCVLEAGMTKEDAKREKEYFLHQTRDEVEIPTLFAPTALTNFKNISANAGGGQDSVLEKNIENPDDIEFWDENGELKQNLLIKGNNLVALHSLEKRLAGKVKLIYIDPPYNTGNDGFSYFDRFNHASWLTFMKNRLEAARELLRDDGVIFVQIDDNEQAYLKVLMDEVFGRGNFVSNFVWRRSGTWWLRGVFPVTTHEYAISFCKDKSRIQDRWLAPYSKESLAEFKYKDDKGAFKTQALYLTSLKYVNSQAYYIELPDGTRAKPPQDVWSWRFIESTFQKELSEWNIIFKKTPNSPLVTEKGIKAEYNIYTKQYISEEWTNPPTIFPDELVWQTRTSKAELKTLFNWDVFSYAKPEGLISYILNLVTNPWDIVLDYHLGSGTTAAVAHKMGRRWIGVEQMEYIDTIAKERLKKVLDGEQGGISKNVGWQGGGDFVYLELKTFNGYFLDEIEKATSKDTLKKIYNDMKRSAFLKFFFDPDDFENEESENGKKYAQLTLAEQKEKLKGVLDMNHIYLNAGNYDETVHTISELDKSLTAKFYGEK